MISEALAGGRAPRAWQRGMARALAPLRALRRATAWLAELAQVCLTLQDEPLLGHTFTALALQPFPSGPPQPAPARPAARRPHLSEPPARRFGSVAEELSGAPATARTGQGPPLPSREPRRLRREPGPDQPSPLRDPEAALRLKSRAGRELLDRLAGSNGIPPVPGARAPESLEQRHQSHEARSRNGSFFAPAVPVVPYVPASGTSHRVWMERLSSRIGRALGGLSGALVPSERPRPRPSSPRPSSPVMPSPGEEGERPLITPALFSHRPPPNRETRENSKTAPTGFPSPDGEASGEGTGVRALGRGRSEAKLAPWLLSLDGETAPAELLERWRTPGREPQARSARPGASPGSASRRSPSPGTAGVPPASSPLAPPQDDALSPALAAGEAAGAAMAPLLPPPPSLPPFLQVQGAGDGVARRPASAVQTVLAPPAGPAALPAEDLDVLAGKIQRILDEEARRHGIPV